MSRKFFTSLRTSLSDQRIDAYRQSTTDTDIDLLECYLWNIAICEALYPTLQNIEIALRNNINDAIRSSCKNPHWLTDQNFLDAQQRHAVSFVIKKAKETGKTLNTGQIIAELTFGFWTGLFDKKYGTVLWNRKDLIRSAFPNMPNDIRTRQTLSKRFTEIRIFRNRVFHHEPIWSKNKLGQQYEDLVEALGWLNHDLRNTNQLVYDRFLLVYRQGSKPYREKLLELISNLS